jgi:hypothetical protein
MDRSSSRYKLIRAIIDRVRNASLENSRGLVDPTTAPCAQDLLWLITHEMMDAQPSRFHLRQWAPHWYDIFDDWFWLADMFREDQDANNEEEPS